MQWFRMYAEFALDPVVQSLAFDDQRHFVMLLCLKCNGTLDREVRDDLRETIILRGLGVHGQAAADAKRRLMEIGLIDARWQPVHWEKRQRQSDGDSTAAERQRRHRAKAVTEVSRVTAGVTSRKCHGDVTRPEAEAEAERASRPPKEQGDEGPSPAATDAPPPPVALTPDEPDEPSACPYAEIVAKYHAALPMCRRVEQLTPARKAAMRARWRNELPTVQAFANYFADVASAPFLTGRVDGRNGRPPFVADLDWLLRPSNFVKVLEGKYHAR